MEKKGLSAVITTLILIALVISAIAIVWVVVKNTIEENISSTESCFDVLGKIKINNKYTLYDPISNKLQFSINLKDIEVDNILILISGGGVTKSLIITNEEKIINGLTNYPDGSSGIKLPAKNEGLTYVYDMSNFSGKPDLIEISPIINGKQCEVCDALYMYEIEGGLAGDDDCVAESTETTCETWVCGTKINNCNEEINCGDCEEGYSCVEGICVEEDCIPDCADPSGVVCGETIIDQNNCGSCPSGTNCESGTCINASCEIEGVSDIYAYVTAYIADSLTIVDISTPSSPTIVGTTGSDLRLDGVFGVQVIGNYAYVAATHADSLTIVDISTPSSPTIVGTTGSDLRLDYAIGIDVV